MNLSSIVIKKAHAHNLKNVSLTLGLGELIVFTGVSGSGKSSMAFDTIYVEGQRRYIQSLSPSARRILEQVKKPPVEEIEGLSPTICIAQKSISKNPRSTVGTLTEIHDYLRILYARLAVAYCPISKEKISPQSKESIIKRILEKENCKLLFLAPYVQGKKGSFKEELTQFLQKGYLKARIDGQMVDLEETFTLDKNKTHDIAIVIDRIKITKENRGRVQEAVTASLALTKGSIITVDNTSKEEEFYSTYGFSKKSKQFYAPLEPHDFSFNSPLGMCPRCMGLGATKEFALARILDPKKSISEDCCSIATSYTTVRYGNIYRGLAKLYNFSVDTPFEELSKEAQHLFLYGSEKKWLKMRFTHPTRKKWWTEYVRWPGVIYEANKRLTEAKSDSYRKKMEALMHKEICSQCKGAQIASYPAAAQFKGVTIIELCAMTIAQMRHFFAGCKLSSEEKLIAGELIKEVEARLTFLQDVGLGYLNLNRTAPTLSGGEAQRVHLASHVGSGLTHITYILDEPSIGLHPRDNRKLIETLQALKQLNNNVIVVEHDEETILAADRVVDFGPRAGTLGGNIIVNGTLQDLVEAKNSLTGAYISHRYNIDIPKARRKAEHFLTLKGAEKNNLKKVTLKIPLGCMVAVTGVSGSGKSSLISETLTPALSNALHRSSHEVGPYKKLEGVEQIDKIIAIDQSPIGRTPRSNPATYSKLFDEIRTLFSQLPDARAKGFLPGRFSFNVKEGSCASCKGLGMVKVDMDFMEDAWITCDLCQGKRFDAATLAMQYKGKSIHDVLKMTAEEALTFFGNIPALKRKLEMLCQVGLSYVTLGQSATTLSGGEAQRLKLAKELLRPATKKTLYVLDEPTTGLHFHDIQALLRICHKLVDQGNTLVIIEHNMDVVKVCDHIIDLGPEAGEKGGEIVATGTPEEICQLATPTGEALHTTLTRKKPSFTAKQKTALVKEEGIYIENAHENNLKNITLTLPKDQITCITGPSGSGKSSFALDTLYAEGNRRYSETLSAYARQFVESSPKPKYSRIEGLMASIAIEQKNHSTNPRSTLGTLTEIYDYLRILYVHMGVAYCPETGEKIESITKEFVLDKILDYPEGEKITLLAPLSLKKTEAFTDLVQRLQGRGFLRIELNETLYELEEEIPFNERRKNEIAVVVDRVKVTPKAKGRIFEALETALTVSDEEILVRRGKKRELYNLTFAVPSTGKSYPKLSPQSFSFNHVEGMCKSCRGLGGSCNECKGTRLNPLSRAVEVEGKQISTLLDLPLSDFYRFIEELATPPILEEVYGQIKARTAFLLEVGLGYLALSRTIGTLSNGEVQRVRISRQLGSRLRGVLYILDEPTIGLHPHDIEGLNRTCKKLKELGNTLVMVEHDPQTIAIADHLLEFGPKAGKEGGELIFAGSVQEHTPYLLTYKHKRRKAENFYPLTGAKKHNLKNLALNIPIGLMTALTGVSGSGKSTLMHEVLAPKVVSQLKRKTGPFTKMVVIDQSPIHLTPRSDVCSYSDLLVHLRTFYASLGRARTKGLLPKHFSYNHPRGMCTSCQGLGYKVVDLLFLPAVRIACENCEGQRLNPVSLEVHYQGLSFGDILQQSVDEALALFHFLPKAVKILENLRDCGLGYLQLGQQMQSLSSGEAQRIKLCKELSKARSKKTLYLLDEPTTGLALSDIDRLLELLHRLVDKGNTMLVIEHSMEFISSADHIVELGPEAGEKGGYLIAEGSPEEIVKNPKSVTSSYLKEFVG